MIPIVQIGPVAVQFPGLLLLGGVWAATLLIERSARRNGLDHDAVTGVVFLALVTGIVGARLGYALRYLDLYLDQPSALLALNPYTLSLSEGLLAGGLAAVIGIQRKELPFLLTLDALAPGAAAFMIAVGLAHVASGDAFGASSDLPWAIELWADHRHPSQIYETLAAGFILWLVLRTERLRAFPGLTFFAMVALHAAARLFLEAFRGDSQLVFGTIRSAQAASLTVLLLALQAIRTRAVRT